MMGGKVKQVGPKNGIFCKFVVFKAYSNAGCNLTPLNEIVLRDPYSKSPCMLLNLT